MLPDTAVSSELRRIQSAHGGLLRAVDVVAEASRTDSPLHPYFEWNDGAAAARYRLHQARQLIRVCVTFYPYEAPQYEVRAFVSLRPQRSVPGGGYQAVVEVLTDQSMRRQLLADALAELNRLKVRFHLLTELDAVFAAIERAQRDFGGQQPPPGFEENGDGDGASV